MEIALVTEFNSNIPVSLTPLDVAQRLRAAILADDGADRRAEPRIRSWDAIGTAVIDVAQ